MNKQEALKHWLTKFKQMSPYKMDAIETTIFEGAFECGWDAHDNELLKMTEGIELDEFGRTDEQFEFELNDLRERSVEA